MKTAQGIQAPFATQLWGCSYSRHPAQLLLPLTDRLITAPPGGAAALSVTVPVAEAPGDVMQVGCAVLCHVQDVTTPPVEDAGTVSG